MKKMAEKQNILVVDDEPSIRKYLQTCWKWTAITVTTVGSGSEALEQIQEGERPDL